MAEKARLAVDIGGTFTDLCLEWNGKRTSTKVLLSSLWFPQTNPNGGMLSGCDNGSLATPGRREGTLK